MYNAHVTELLRTYDLDPKVSLLKIGFDGDGVLIDSPEVVVNRLNQLLNNGFGLNANYSQADISELNSVQRWLVDQGVLPIVAKKVEQDYWFSPDILFQAKPVRGSLRLVASLRRLGASVEFVTSRMSGFYDSTYEWLNKHFLGLIEQERIHVRKDNDFRGGSEFKADEIRRLGIDVFVEDSPSQVFAILERSPNTHVIFKPLGKITADFDPGRVTTVTNMFDVSGLFCNPDFVSKLLVSHNG